MNTKAAILNRINEPLEIRELRIPDLGPGQVLVRIEYSGVCHSQLNEMQGLKGEDKFLPHTLGHEGAGIVEAVGEGVQKVGKGDRVVATWIQAGGMNAPSVKYTDTEGTIINSGAISTFMQHAVISENRLVKISADMPLKTAALLGCALPTGAGMLKMAASEMKLNSVAIFGTGGIGLSAIIAAHVFGVAQIIAVDVAKNKLAQAKEMGATDCVDASAGDSVQQILQLTGGKGVDCAIECAGTRATMEAAIRATRGGGGLCIIGGNLPAGQTFSVDPMDLIKGKRLVGSWGGGTRPDEDIPQYVAKYLSGGLKLDELITHEYDLASINRACLDLQGKRVGRAMIKMHD